MPRPWGDDAARLRREISRKIDELTGEAEKRVTAVPGLTIVRRVKPTAPSCVTYEPSVAVITQGRKEVVLGKKTLVYDEQHYLLTSVDLPIVSRIPEASAAKPFIGLALKLESAVVREVLSVAEPAEAEKAGPRTAMGTGQTTIEILDACRRLLELVEKPQEIPVLSGLLKRELVFRMLQGREGARLREIATLGNQSQRIARAIEWLRINYGKQFRVEELAEMSGMGISTFHHQFRALTTMSPLQYQKQLRLQTARERMMHEGMDAASAAFAVGYESASQFSREYRRMFGQPPMADVRKFRSGEEQGEVWGGGVSAVGGYG